MFSVQCVVHFVVTVESILDTLAAKAKEQRLETVTEGTPSPRITLRPAPLTVDIEVVEGLQNMTYKCRPSAALPHSDLISAYAGLFITFVMAIYAR
jgi:hypothetical protein